MSDAVSLRTSKYRHHKAKNLAVVTFAGRDIYLGTFGTAESKQEYRRLVAEYIQSGAMPRTEIATEISVIEVIAAYLKFAKGYYRKTGKFTREYGLIVKCCRFIKSLYGYPLWKRRGLKWRGWEFCERLRETSTRMAAAFGMGTACRSGGAAVETAPSSCRSTNRQELPKVEYSGI